MPAYLSLATINKFVPLARKLGVSAVARGSGGFLSAYRRAGGNPDRLSDQWAKKRDAFVARHMAQVKQKGESLWEDGLPSRRHLALIMWAYSPNASKLSKTTVREDSMRETREAPRAGNPTTKPGKHGTLYLYQITYKDKDDPGSPEFTSVRWAYSLEHIDDITQDWEANGWRILSVARVPEGGGSMHRAIRHRTKESRHVGDFNTVNDLADHARREGATHIMHIDDETHIYFKRRDGKYEKAEVWQKDGYWHTQAPGSRAVVPAPPRSAQIIGAGVRGPPKMVDDYIAVDRRGRKTAGPFKSYGDARGAAGPADIVQFVPAGRRGVVRESGDLIVTDLDGRRREWWIAAERDCPEEYEVLRRALSEQHVGKGHDNRVRRAREKLMSAMAKRGVPYPASPGAEEKMSAGRRTSERRVRDQLPLPGSDEHDGEQYADEQLNSDYFKDWIWGQMSDGAKLAPEARIPLESPADFKRLARRMLQDLEFDTRRQRGGSAAFFAGMRRRLNDPHTIDWLAEWLQYIDGKIKTPRAPAPVSKKKTRSRRRS